MKKKELIIVSLICLLVTISLFLGLYNYMKTVNPQEINICEKNKKFVVENVSNKKILPIVLTLNQFGGLAVNTSMILKKEDNQPYPWVCNWHDLENIIEIL